MTRYSIFKQKNSKYDFVYNNSSVQILFSQLLKNGKKLKTYKIIFNLFKNLKKKLKKNPIYIFEHALKNIALLIHAKKIKYKNKIGYTLCKVTPYKAYKIAITWLIKSINQHKKTYKQTFFIQLLNEIILAFQNRGFAIKKKKEIIQIMNANKVFIS